MHKICNQLQQPQHRPVDVSSNTHGLRALFIFWMFALLWCSSLCLWKHFTFPLFVLPWPFFFYALLLCVIIPCSWFMSSASCDLDWILRIRWIGMVSLLWQGKDEGVSWNIQLCSVLVAVIAPALPFGEAAVCSCVSQTSFWVSPSCQCQLNIWCTLHLLPEVRSQRFLQNWPGDPLAAYSSHSFPCLCSSPACSSCSSVWFWLPHLSSATTPCLALLLMAVVMPYSRDF